RGLRDVGGRGARAGALLEQRDLAFELRELAHEVCERFLGGRVRVLADLAFSVGDADKDRARLIDAAPGRRSGGLVVRSHRAPLLTDCRSSLGVAGPRADRRYWIVKAVICTV